MKNRLSRLRSSFIPMFLLAGLILVCVRIEAQVTGVGMTARDFSIVNRLTGDALRLYDYSGHVIVLDFFAWWCPPCRASSPDVEENVLSYYRSRGGNPAGLPVTVISINIEPDSPEETDSYISDFGIELVGDDFEREAWGQFNTENAIPLFVVLNGAPNSSSHKQWEVLHSAAGYYGAEHMRSLIDSVKVAVPSPPSIQKQPTSLVAASGTDVTFEVTVSGSAPLTLQWYKDGVAVAGATGNRLKLTSVTAEAAGDYYLVATNSKGTATSDVARLTVQDLSAVVFGSATLETAVRAKLGIPSGVVTGVRMMELASLEARSQQISSLKGLEKAKALKSLDLYYNAVTDVAPLAGLTGLTNLNLSYNSISNITALAGLTALVDLDLSGNAITNHASLAGLKALTRLNLLGTRMTGAGVLAGLTNLAVLNLGYDAVADLAPLAGMKRLRELDLSGSQVRELNPILGLSKLDTLTLNYAPVSDFSGLRLLPALSKLQAQGVKSRDFSWLRNIRQLTVLNLADGVFDSIDLLAGYANLQSLDVSRTRVVDFRPTQQLPRLEVLYARNLFLTNASSQGVGAATSVRNLDISENQLETLDGLQPLSSLGVLYASKNRLTNIAAIVNLTGLRYVYVDRNYLETAAGTPVAAVETTLKSRGTYVYDVLQGFAIKVLGMRSAADGCHLTINGKAGKTYRLLRADQPSGGWVSLGSKVSPASEFEMVDTAAGARKTGFYRVVVDTP